MADQGSTITNIVLVGRAGNGKSSTGNTLLSKHLFNVNGHGRGHNNRCKMHKAATLDGPIINVIDTPGLFDLSVSEEYISKELINWLSMAEEGIHAVLFVISVSQRIPQEEEYALNALLHIIDSKILDYFIVVFTGGDMLEDSDQTLDDYLREGCPEFLKRVLSLCGGRKVLFNNKTQDEGKKTKQLNQLLAHVTDIGKRNGGMPYTDKMRPKIKDEIKEQEKDIESKNPAETNLQVMKEKLQIEHDQTINMMTHTDVSALKHCAASLEREMRQLKDSLQSNDTQTMNMMVEYALKQSGSAHEREMRQLKDTLQLKDTHTMNMIEKMVDNALKECRTTYEREMCQLKDTLQLKETQTINMIEKMMENAFKQSAATHEREMRQLRDTLQQDQHLLSSPRKSKTCECNIM